MTNYERLALMGLAVICRLLLIIARSNPTDFAGIQLVNTAGDMVEAFQAKVQEAVK